MRANVFALILTLLLFAIPSAAQAPEDVNLVPLCSVDDLPTCIGGSEPGRTAWVLDALDAEDCSVGGGTAEHACTLQADGTFVAGGAGSGNASLIRSPNNCEGVLTGTENDLCIQDDTDELYYCSTPTCAGAGWVAVSPGGTGLTSLTPWTEPIDADGFTAGDLGSPLSYREFVGRTGSSLLRSEILFKQDDLAPFWTFGALRGSSDYGGGITRDTIASISYNMPGGGGAPLNANSPYGGMVIEGSWTYSVAGVLNPYPDFEYYILGGRNRVAATVTTGSSFAADEALAVVETATNVVQAKAVVLSWSSPTLTVAMVEGNSASNVAAATTSTFQTTRTIATTATTGSWIEGNLYTVMPAVTVCGGGNNLLAAEAQIYLVDDGGGGASPTITFLPLWGDIDAIASGKKLCQSNATFTSTLNAAPSAPAKTASWDAGAPASENWRVYNLNIDTSRQRSDFNIRTTAAQQAAGYNSLRAAVAADGTEFVSVMSNLNGSSVYRFIVGDETRPFDSLFHGRIGIHDGDSHYGYFDGGNLTAARVYTMPDQSGTLAMVSDIPTVDVVTTGTFLTGEIPITSDTTGDELVPSGATISANVTTLAPSTTGPDEIRLYEDSDGDGTANYYILRGVTAGQTITGNTGVLILTRASRAVGSASGARGPVVGAVSNGGTFDTPEELCDLSYGPASVGVTQTCVANTSKSYDPTTAVATWIACADTVTTGTYFETVCNAE